VNVIYTIADLQPESGGPSRSVSALAESVAARGDQVRVVAMEYANGSEPPVVPRPPVSTTLVPCHGRITQRLHWTPAFAPTLLRLCRGGEPCILHDNGLWLPTNHTAANVARRVNVPLIVSPRGMLTTWALQFRSWKKKPAWWLYQQRDLKTAIALHATSKAEAEGFRALGLTQPIAIIPNGVESPPPLSVIPPPPSSSPLSSDSHTALFLGRIHPIKGLANLVEAWASLGRGQKPGSQWRMIIAGNDENGHQAQLQAAIDRHGLQASFEFIGPVVDQAKWQLLRSTDLFILPSHSENFGIAVAEALASGLPVITTKGTPWQELESHRCGWWVEPESESLAAALRRAIALSDEQRRQMGERGRKLIESKYTWPSVAAQMKSVYEWMLGQAERPDCVQM
jgi:glycosyltransferase involved in cell wall biosynthesis